jgi:hypothetical protein
MLSFFSGSLRVFVAIEACDMRKGFEGLSALVGSILNEEGKSGALCVAFASSHEKGPTNHERLRADLDRDLVGNLEDQELRHRHPVVRERRRHLRPNLDVVGREPEPLILAVDMAAVDSLMPALTAPSCSKSCPAHSWRWADWPHWSARSVRSSAFVASIVETWREKDSHGARVKKT